MEKVIGLITANYSTSRRSVLTEERPVASLPFAGRYRMIDFPLSNMVNCGIRTGGLVMPYNYRSLIDHVGSGKDWMLDRKNGGLFVLPGSAFGTSRSGARFLIRDILHNKSFLTRSDAKYVICSASNYVYNIDYSELVAAHEQSGADVTMLTRLCTEDDADTVGVMFDGERVRATKHGVTYGDTAFLDCFIADRELLLRLLDWYEAVDYMDLFEAMEGDFGRVDVRSHIYEGYAAPIFTTEAFFEHNMDLLDPKISDQLFDPARSIKTKAHDTPPTKYERGCYVRNSLISAGTRVYGSVADSILGRSIVIESGATVRNSIIMQGCVIESGARVENAIIDRQNVIPAGTEFRGTPEDILIKEKGHA